PVPTDIACEKCGKPMLIRTSVRGRFLGCSGYPKCRNTAQLPPELEEAKAAGEEAKITGEAKTEEEKAAPEVVG
ncbi:MAG TPA: topoisomerase DNA-binding C4 zinc finger domain-containing protein, partial [Planctomycetota bacterium]|nr:topoisomerase DNA-binding C4 zinc finger domain-containing protein [Planctomycetota bacterium]